MKYKLIAVDVDGTLLNSNSNLTEGTENAIKKAVEGGVLFTVSTGRPAAGVKRFSQITNKDMPFILYNGAVVMMSVSEKVLYRQGLDIVTAEEIIAEGKKRNTTIALWTEKSLCAFELNDRIKSYKSISGIEPLVIKKLDDLKGETIIKVLWYDEIDKIFDYQTEMKKKLGQKANCHISRPYFLEFVDLRASKAIALEKIGKSFGIRNDEMIAVGDGYNDISMIKYAGLGVAMGNAPDGVKAVADITAPTNDDDGVAHIIEKYILKG